MLEELTLHTPKAAALEVMMPKVRTSRNLKGLNLDTELHNNYCEARDYLDMVLANDEFPPNQVAQVFNTLNSIMKEIVRAQTEVQNAEKVKNLEQAMIFALKKTCSEETQNAFFEEFEILCRNK